ncbi:unnamed protein product [Phytomonas sp. Hart1]|nr:unnamed protein product [Phytomonas sp. Hart1]|eukprot:CCW66727.1 unnamed protein product [Phytomonas sp. isolate Hart1]
MTLFFLNTSVVNLILLPPSTHCYFYYYYLKLFIHISINKTEYFYIRVFYFQFTFPLPTIVLLLPHHFFFCPIHSCEILFPFFFTYTCAQLSYQI